MKRPQKFIAMRPDADDLTGKQFGRLRALGPVRREKRHGRSHLYWLCACNCGEEAEVTSRHLIKGEVVSCGCRGAETRIQQSHGLSSTPAFKNWSSMMARCYSPGYPHFKRWGGRGIKVCRRWQKFENFYADMGPRPSSDHSIDRIDNDGNYEPGNCRWASPTQQSNNRANSKFLTARGETLTQVEWSRRTGLGERTISKRLARGLSVEAALFTPRRSGPCHAWANKGTSA